MTPNKFEFSYTVYDGSAELGAEDARLLEMARAVTANAYAPYSHFNVGAVALLVNGETVSGTNQENASYPVGICAERVLLGTIATLHPKVPVHTIAISYNSKEVETDHPISPCGMCRQALLEYELRTGHPIRILLGGQEGRVYVIETVKHLLPFAFTGEQLK